MSSPFDKFAVLILFSPGCSAPHTPHLPKSCVFGASKLDLPYEKLAFTLEGILERRVVFARKKETPQAEEDTGYGIPNNSNPINHPPQLDCVSHRCIRQRNGTIYALMIYFNNYNNSWVAFYVQCHRGIIITTHQHRSVHLRLLVRNCRRSGSH